MQCFTRRPVLPSSRVLLLPPKWACHDAHAATLRLIPLPPWHWLVLAGSSVQGGCPQCRHAVKADSPSAGMRHCRSPASAITDSLSRRKLPVPCRSSYIAATRATSARLVVRRRGGCRAITGIGHVQCSRASPRPTANVHHRRLFCTGTGSLRRALRCQWRDASSQGRKSSKGLMCRWPTSSRMRALPT
jgi:hypothetical protein